MSAMNRITMHHSGGGLVPSALDKEHYHRIIGGDGHVISGDHAILDNAPGRPFTSGTYAAHTLHLNSGNIGLSMASMGNAVWGNPHACPFFPTTAQIDALIVEAALLCKAWSIQPDRSTLLSHAEVEITLKVKQRGKWDFDYSLLGKVRSRDPVAVGDEIRTEVRRHLQSNSVYVPAVSSPRLTLRRGSTGQAVVELQKALNIAPADGQFGPATHAAVAAFQRKKNLLPDGVAGRMTWAALGL